MSLLRAFHLHHPYMYVGVKVSVIALIAVLVAYLSSMFMVLLYTDVPSSCWSVTVRIVLTSLSCIACRAG